MTTYLVVALLLVVFGLFFESINSATSELSSRKKIPNYFFIIPSFLLLFFISTFRGDFNTDYRNYTNIFHLINNYSLTDVFTVGFNIENGYILLNKLIGMFTDNEIYLFAITTFIILYGFYHQFNKYSVNIWLSVLMFVTAGSYYASFNITRQILTVAIIFMGSKFLYERKFFKYLLVVILATLFHKSAIIMLPFYFILNFRINLRNMFFILAGSVFIILFFDSILAFVQNYAYDNYTEDAYGMDGQRFTNAVLPLALLIFSFFHIKKLENKNTMHRIWFNAVIFYAVFFIIALQVEMLKRIGYFFAPYALLLIPYIFSRMQDKHLRVIYMMVLISALVLYNYITLADSVYDPFYFIWDK